MRNCFENICKRKLELLNRNIPFRLFLDKEWKLSKSNFVLIPLFGIMCKLFENMGEWVNGLNVVYQRFIDMQICVKGVSEWVKGALRPSNAKRLYMDETNTEKGENKV